MKLLFDQNLSFKLCRALSDLFPGSAQLRQIALDRADDRTIWQHAKSGGFVLVTMDSDFADLAALLGAPPKIIWLRCGNQSTDALEKILREHAAAMSVFEQDRDANCLEIF
ncbi:MAG: DUF5615 family PIN-like protein [Candidatus Acidiferrales bacterium]